MTEFMTDPYKWLATYDRETGSLSTYAARHCGYGKLVVEGLVTNRGTEAIPHLFITANGINFLLRLPPARD